MGSKKFGYIRISSQEQNEDRQVDTMLKIGIDERDLFIDKASGKNLDRVKYQALKETLREGDTVVFDSLTRLSRNMNDITNEYAWFVDNGIRLKFLNEPYLDTTDERENQDVMKEAINRIVLTILSAFAQKEREDIKKRQREGIEAARKRGKHLGRPKKELTEEQKELFIELYNRWKNEELTAVEFMKELGISKSMFYKVVKKYEEEHNVGSH